MIRTPEHRRSDSNQANAVKNQARALCTIEMTPFPSLESYEALPSPDIQENPISSSSYVDISIPCSSWSHCNSAQVWQFSIPISIMENLRSIPEVTSVRVIADYNRHVSEVTSRTGKTAQELGVPVYPEVHWSGTSVTEARKIIRQRTGLKDIDYIVVLPKKC